MHTEILNKVQSELLPGQSGLNFLVAIILRTCSKIPVARLVCYEKLYFIVDVYRFSTYPCHGS